MANEDIKKKIVQQLHEPPAWKPKSVPPLPQPITEVWVVSSNGGLDQHGLFARIEDVCNSVIMSYSKWRVGPELIKKSSHEWEWVDAAGHIITARRTPIYLNTQHL